MPRPEKIIDRGSGAVSAFAVDLRALRRDAGLTYEGMAEVARYSRSALAKVVNGQLPTSWPVVRAYVIACGGDEKEWYDRWRALQPKPWPAVPGTAAPIGTMPDPGSLRTIPAYLAALADLRRQAGLSYRQVSELTRVGGERIAPTTLFDLLHGDRLPPQPVLLAYLRACGVVQAPVLAAWRVAYTRLNASAALHAVPRQRPVMRVFEPGSEPEPPLEPLARAVDRSAVYMWLGVAMLLMIAILVLEKSA